MSSPPADRTRVRKRRPFETWRKIALAGALILLAGSILAAMTDDLPRLVEIAYLGPGWGLLAAGFGKFMIDRRRRTEDSTKP